MSKVQRPENVTTKAMLACANWLSFCLKIGWSKSELDDLENIWWRYHDRLGNLTTKAKSK